MYVCLPASGGMSQVSGTQTLHADASGTITLSTLSGQDALSQVNNKLLIVIIIIFMDNNHLKLFYCLTITGYNVRKTD